MRAAGASFAANAWHADQSSSIRASGSIPYRDALSKVTSTVASGSSSYATQGRTRSSATSAGSRIPWARRYSAQHASGWNDQYCTIRSVPDEYLLGLRLGPAHKGVSQFARRKAATLKSGKTNGLPIPSSPASDTSPDLSPRRWVDAHRVPGAAVPASGALRGQSWHDEGG